MRPMPRSCSRAVVGYIDIDQAHHQRQGSAALGLLNLW